MLYKYKILYECLPLFQSEIFFLRDIYHIKNGLHRHFKLQKSSTVTGHPASEIYQHAAGNTYPRGQTI